VVQQWLFRPAGATRCPDKREMWRTGSGPQVRSPCPISHLSGHKRGNIAPKTVKISNFGPYVAFKVLIWLLSGDSPAVGHFPTNIQSPSAAKLLIGSKKVRGYKNGTDLLYHMPSMVGIVGRAPAIDETV